MSFSLSQSILNLTDTTTRVIDNCKRVDGVKRKHICSYGIAHKYNDFRDTMVRYYVYLPYADTIELENAKILGKILSIDCYFDVRTGNIKYYLMADGTLINTCCGCVRLDLPVSATMPVNKYNEIRQNSSNMYGSAVNMGRGIVGGAIGGGMKGGATGAVVGGTVGVVDAIINAPKMAMEYAELKTPMSTTFNGNFNASTCIDDPLDIYLYTIEPNIEYDTGIRNNYGLPCNTYDTISNHHGFMEIDDIKLTGEIPVDDKLEIISILQKGFYIV